MRLATSLVYLGAANTMVAAMDFSATDADGSVWAKLNSKARAVSRSAKKSFYRRLGGRQSSSTGWNPPSDLVEPLKEVWDHTLETYNSGDAFGFQNYGWDQIMATKG